MDCLSHRALGPDRLTADVPGRAQRRAAVVGGGYAGMAAAVTLAEAGWAVTVFEAGRVLGGRARVVSADGRSLDNGQHILSGAYHELLRLLGVVGLRERAVLRRVPLRLETPGGLRLRAPRLPAPWHTLVAIVGASGLTPAERLAVVRFMSRVRLAGFRAAPGQSVQALLECQGQSPKVTRRLWEPLCLAALNTPIAIADAAVFLAVLRDALAGPRPASDLLLPIVDLSSLFPIAAAQYVVAHGGRILTHTRVRQMQQSGAAFALHTGRGTETFEHVVLATAPWHAARLLTGVPDAADLATRLSQLPTEPIATLYLGFPGSVGLPFPMIGLPDGPGQWAFDRGALLGTPGELAVVISANGPHLALTDDELLRLVAGQLRRALGIAAPPVWHRLIVERRATFACQAGLARPDCRTPMPGLFLAGDYTASEYPATLESAVRSGVRAARLALGTEPS